jgi:hypothetical protein
MKAETWLHWIRKAAIGAMLCASVAFAQAPESMAPMDTQAKWKNFIGETLSPLTIGAGLFNGAEAHLTNTDPKYGTDLPAFGAQVGASILDTATQNFFADFVLASEFHEDPRYFRRGEGFSMRSRIRYAISRSVVTRTDDGRSEFNWSNVLGTALSGSLSNAYYPASARTAAGTFQRIGVGILGTGLVRLAPEFWPDFRRKVFGKR